MSKIVLGGEFDGALRERTRRVLHEAGAKLASSEWGIGGSQELTVEEWILDGATLILEAKTYMGLSLSGPDDLVVRITDALGSSQAT
ncbi:hypothetical protein [Phenylobacterium kunshanense]|uniref:Uncharacterized protein n=1 Tax=Phenylobacterium kunshanense TaxID=1445034 RepID=A0A328B5Y0_9CAUL|nr:hypothetical protein [Phenylobacterium kunshanense]RAK62543.1 hypothetical protein DJ019_19180 [Phenylobacterium kunshanense]